VWTLYLYSIILLTFSIMCSGRINYVEFVNAFKIADKGPKRRTSLNSTETSGWQSAIIHQVSNVLYQHRIQLRSAFRMFDTDNDGKVTAAEFQGGLKAINALLDHPLSEMQVEQLLKSLDKNGDGYLDYKEFLEGFQVSSITIMCYISLSDMCMYVYSLLMVHFLRILLRTPTASEGHLLHKKCYQIQIYIFTSFRIETNYITYLCEILVHLMVAFISLQILTVNQTFNFLL